MNFTSRTFITFLSTISLLASGTSAQPSSSNLDSTYAIVNANIYTVDKKAPNAQAMLIENGVILRVGSNQHVLKDIVENINIIDLHGKFLMPGFQDAHQHLAEAGFNEVMCLFDERKRTIEAYRHQILDCANEAKSQKLPWVLGAGISVSEMLADSSQTPRSFLDKLIPDMPVLILDNLGHGAWVNTPAMQLAGYKLDVVKQPKGGILLTDKKGTATGVLFENAQQRVRDAAFQAVDPNQSLAYKGLLKGLETMAKNGVTTISDAGGYWTRRDHRIWERAENEGKMTVRAFNALYLFPDREPIQQISHMRGLFTNDASNLVKFNTVKIYVDGILSLGTSALIRDYTSTVVEALEYPKGFEYFESSVLNHYATEFDKAGFQLHFHVTGDRAAKLALNAIESAAIANQSTDRRHRLTHAYLIDPIDQNRFEQLGVIVDFQLNPSSLDNHYYRPYIKKIIGPERAENLIPVRTMIDAGATTILSSDFDAGPLSALGTIERALTRNDNRSQRVATIDKAIEMVTIDVAYALHNEHNTGSIEVGKQADLIVLDKDITKLPKEKISGAKIESTIIGGRVVYDQANNFD